MLVCSRSADTTLVPPPSPPRTPCVRRIYDALPQESRSGRVQLLAPTGPPSWRSAAGGSEQQAAAPSLGPPGSAAVLHLAATGDHGFGRRLRLGGPLLQQVRGGGGGSCVCTYAHPAACGFTWLPGVPSRVRAAAARTSLLLAAAVRAWRSSCMRAPTTARAGRHSSAAPSCVPSATCWLSAGEPVAAAHGAVAAAAAAPAAGAGRPAPRVAAPAVVQLPLARPTRTAASCAAASCAAGRPFTSPSACWPGWRGRSGTAPSAASPWAAW